MKQNEIKDIISLLNMVFEGWPDFDLSSSQKEHWKWKYVDTPFKSSSIVVGVHDERVISCFHDGDRRFKVDNNVVLGGYGGDLAVNSDYRELGLYNKMDDLLVKERINKGKQIICSESGNPIVIKRAKRHNIPEYPKSISNMLKVEDIDYHLRYLKRDHVLIEKFGFSAIEKITKIRARSQRDIQDVIKNYDVNTKKKFGGEIDVFWNKIKDSYFFIPELSKKYVNWRYCDKRGGDYNVRVIEEDDQLLGYSVLRITKRGDDYLRGYIVDMLTLPNQPAIAESLMVDAVSFFEKRSINSVNYFVLKDDPYQKTAEKFGFVNIKLYNHAFLRPLNGNLEMNEKIRNTKMKFHYSMSITDFI